MGMEVLMVERSELVKVKGARLVSLASVVLLELEESVDEAVLVVEASVPVPVSSCALTPKAARPKAQSVRCNMFARMLM